MDNWVIRTARPSDLDAIVAFNLAMAWETEQLKLVPDVLRAGVRSVLEDSSKGFYLVAATSEGMLQSKDDA